MKWCFKTSFATRNNWGLWLNLNFYGYLSAFYKAKIVKKIHHNFEFGAIRLECPSHG